MAGVSTAERSAVERDATDPVPSRRAAFAVPPWPGGRHPEWAYFAGNSLGLMPRAARARIEDELRSWSELGVEGWFEGPSPWLERAAGMRPSFARLVGADQDEVAVMSSLTVNLHLLLASFYRPAGRRQAILVEAGAFPSDQHAVHAQVAWHGHDPEDAVVRLRPRPGEQVLRTEYVVATIEREGPRLAVVLLGAVGYLTGELMDVEAITAATHAAGAVSLWDLAHAVGNVPLSLHDAGVDAAAWCSYKYVNGGPGAPGGVFVHARHHGADVPRLAGWWGVDPDERFRMDPHFRPRRGAEGWAVSTPGVLSLAPLEAALAVFDESDLDALRQRSTRLTGYLETLLDDVATRRRLALLTPRDPSRRGCQLSVAVEGARALAGTLREAHGVVCDFREPDVLRFAPTPLYSTYLDCARAATALEDVLPPR
jgi:kynureninase